MSSDYYCKICDITCTGQAPYDQHLNSAKHLKKAKLTESQTSVSTNTNPSSPKINPRSPTTPNNNLFEDSSTSSLSVSISPETMRILLEWNHPLGYKPFCDICQLPLHGENNADIHFNANNKLHSQKLAAWKQIREDDPRYSCKVCSEVFSNENLMREHFNSDSHENVVQQKSNLGKFIQIFETYKKVKQVRKQAEGNLHKTNEVEFILFI
jgi:hypothetical protein